MAQGSTNPTVNVGQVAGTTTSTAAAGVQKVGASDSIGQAQYNFPAGFVRTSDEPRQIFYDPFDGALDTTNRWFQPITIGTAIGATVGTGSLLLGSGTSTGSAFLESQPRFTPTIPSWLGVSFAISLEFPLAANANRFWGLGSSLAIPTSASPVWDGFGFEVDTTGTLNAVVFASGVRTVIAALTAPVDALNHRYIVYYRTDKIFWYYDGLSTPVATSSFQGPTIQTLPVKFAVVGSSPVASRTISCTGLAVWDTGKNSSMISDGANPWRRAQVTANGELVITGLGGQLGIIDRPSVDLVRQQNLLLAAILTELRVLTSITQAGLNVRDDLDQIRNDPGIIADVAGLY